VVKVIWHKTTSPPQTDGSIVFASMGCPFFPKSLPLPMGDLNPHLIHGPLGPPKSSTQTASRLVQPFLQGSLVWQTDRPTDRQTDHATRSLTIDRIYVRSTAMRSNNNNGTGVLYLLCGMNWCRVVLVCKTGAKYAWHEESNGMDSQITGVNWCKCNLLVFWHYDDLI